MNSIKLFRTQVIFYYLTKLSLNDVKIARGHCLYRPPLLLLIDMLSTNQIRQATFRTNSELRVDFNDSVPRSVRYRQKIKQESLK